MNPVLPDRLVVDLVTLSDDIDKLVKILRKYLKYIRCSEFVDVGNDIQYAIREIRFFRKKIRNLVIEESSKYETDLFGYRFNSFNNYRYLEMIFSSDYKKITSLRMYGKKRNRNIRYSFFNLSNPYDYNVINLIYNIKEIIEDFEGAITVETQYIDFLKNYFLPVPGIYTKKQKDIKCLDNVSKQFDTGKPKTYEEVLKENEKFNLPEFKSFIFDIRKINFDTNGTIDFLLGDGKIEDIISKMEEFAESDPLKAINVVYEEILNKFNISDIMSFAQQLGLPEINIFPIDILNNLSIIDLFEKIDFLPKIVSKQIYLDLKNPNIFKDFGLDLDLSSIILELENYGNQILLEEEPSCVNKIKIRKIKKNIKFKDIFLNLKIKFPNIYPKIELKFNELFPRDIFINIILKHVNLDAFSFKIPKIKIPNLRLPSLEIKDLFGDFAAEFDGIVLKTISITLTDIIKGLLELLLKIGKLDDFIFENILINPGDINPKIPKFQNIFKEDWLVYLDYAFRLIIDTNELTTPEEEMSDEIKRIDNISNIRKVKNKKRPIGVDICAPSFNSQITNRISKKNIKKLNLEDLTLSINSGDIDSIIENIKYFNYSEQHDFFATKNVADEKVVDVLKVIAKSLDEDNSTKKVEIPKTSIEIAKSLSDMIEQIETVLTSKELSLLLKGKYTETTAEIVRTICKINFPVLSDKVDPIKYFTMLGKIIGSVDGVKK